MGSEAAALVMPVHGWLTACRGCKHKKRFGSGDPVCDLSQKRWGSSRAYVNTCIQELFIMYQQGIERYQRVGRTLQNPRQIALCQETPQSCRSDKFFNVMQLECWICGSWIEREQQTVRTIYSEKFHLTEKDRL